MSWTKLSDDFVDRADLAELDFADRWHYLAMIQLCSRGGHLTGDLRMVDARRASDHPDPTAAIARLVSVGLLETSGASVRVVQIDQHIPPPSVRQKAEADKLRKRRQRAHQAGDHALCIPDHCPSAPVTRDNRASVTRDVTRDPGTGQDGPGRDQRASARPRSDGWPTAIPGQPATFPLPPYDGTGPTERESVA